MSRGIYMVKMVIDQKSKPVESQKNVAFIEPHSNLEINVNLPKTIPVDLEEKQTEFEDVLAGPSGKKTNEDDVSSVLNSEQEQILEELSDFVEDSDCSVKDKDYIPDSATSEDESVKEAVANNPSADDEITDTSIPGKKRSRWKKSDPSQWKKNVIKRQKIESKAPKPIDCSKCRFKCSVNFSPELRLEICKNYWKCEFNRRKDFILNNVESNVPVRRKVIRTSNKRARLDSKTFFFSKVRVCKNFFIRTLCISKEVIEHAFLNQGEGRLFVANDKRGKHAPSNKTQAEDLEIVKKHIDSFPVMESHYTRKFTKRHYLDSKLSIAKMHSLYKELCEKEGLKPVSLITYRRFFCTNYNYSFYKPKKDQCQICLQYKTSRDFERKDDKLEINYQAHIERKEDCYTAKVRDKERALNDKNFVCCTFDLQCVLQIPSSDVSPMYYSRKLCTYNLTIYEMAPPNSAFCYVWTELNGKRGSSEIGTCLYNYINQLSEEVTELSLFSDTCSGQNRNQNISALLLYLVQTNPKLQVIEQKFLESGHSYMEVDSMHSAIEKAQKFVPVYTIHDWLTIFRMARTSRSNKKPYNVKELKYSDFLDLENLSKILMKNKLKDTAGEKVNWLKIKCFRYTKSKPWILQYRYDHTSDYKEINVLGKGRPLQPNEITITRSYKKMRAISLKKKQDLLKLCKNNVIPEEYHYYYKSLPTSKDAKDVVPGPADCDSEEESELEANDD